MKEKVEEAITEYKNCLSGMFTLVKGLMTDSKEVEGGSDGRLCFSDNERGEVWKDYMEMIMIGIIMWEGDAVERRLLRARF